jgi:hypothetical protein
MKGIRLALAAGKLRPHEDDAKFLGKADAIRLTYRQRVDSGLAPDKCQTQAYAEFDALTKEVQAARQAKADSWRRQAKARAEDVEGRRLMHPDVRMLELEEARLRASCRTKTELLAELNRFMVEDRGLGRLDLLAYTEAAARAGALPDRLKAKLTEKLESIHAFDPIRGDEQVLAFEGLASEAEAEASNPSPRLAFVGTAEGDDTTTQAALSDLFDLD